MKVRKREIPAHGGGASLLAAAAIPPGAEERGAHSADHIERANVGVGAAGRPGSLSTDSDPAGGLGERPKPVHWRLSDWAEEPAPPPTYAPPVAQEPLRRSEVRQWRVASRSSSAWKAVYVAGALVFAVVMVGFIRECGRPKIAAEPSAYKPGPVGAAKPMPIQSPAMAIQPAIRESPVSGPSVPETEGTEAATADGERNLLGSIPASSAETGEAGSVRGEAQARSVVPPPSRTSGTKPSYIRIYFRAREFPTHTMVRLDGRAVPGLDSRRLVSDLVVQSEVLKPGEYDLEVWMNPARSEDGQSARAAVHLVLDEGHMAAFQVSFSAEAQRLILAPIP